MKAVLRVFACVSVIMALTAAVACADDHVGVRPFGGIRMACRADAATFCKEFDVSSGESLRCLEEHYNELSDGCYKVLQKIAAMTNPQSATPDDEQSGH
jgi:hypothetical protein